MKIWGVLAVLIALPAANTAALDQGTAKAFLLGDWVSSDGAYTWQFDAKGKWVQHNGGVLTEAGFTVEAMPANLFRLTSDHAGVSYVVHVAPTFNSFKLFKAGELDTGIAMYRWVPTSPSSSAAPPPEVE